VRSLVYANLTTRRPASTVTGANLELPTLRAGQAWEMALRFTRQVDGVYAEEFPPILAVRASLGRVDARPTGGTWRLQIGSGASTSANTTGVLDYNVAPKALEVALNGLSGGAGDFTVDWEAGSYLIRRANGDGVALVARGNRLRPSAAVRVRAYEIDHEWVHEVRLIQAPVAFTDAGEKKLPPPPYVETVTDGFTSFDATWFVNEVQNLIVPDTFRGAYRILFDYHVGNSIGLPRRTDLLSLDDGPAEIEAAINRILDYGDGGQRRVTVSNPTQGVARIEFGGDDLRGVDVPQLEIQAYPLPGDTGDWTLKLDLNRAEMWAALREAASVVVPFEVEVDVLRDRNDAGAGWDTVKLWSVPVTLERPLLYEGLAEAQSIDWLRPISPRSYIPFSPEQIITGQQHWVGTIGAVYGTAVEATGEETYVIDHQLGTEAVQVAVRENTTPGIFVTPERVEVAGENSVEIALGTALAGGTYAVIVTAAGPRSVFQAHGHPLAQIEGLTEVLENIDTRLRALELLLPKPGVASGNAAPKPTVFRVPSFGEVLPDLSLINVEKDNVTLASQIFAAGPRNEAPAPPPKGTEVAAAIDKAADEKQAASKDPDKLPSNIVMRAVLPGIGRSAQSGAAAKRDATGNVIEPEIPAVAADPAVWPARRGSRFPVLLQAVESAGEAVLDTTVLPIGTALDAGKVYRYTGTETEFYLPGDFGRKDQRVRAGETFTYEQGAYYRVRNESGGNIYYPVEFERELWRVYLGPDQFPQGAVLTVSGELRLRLVGEFFEAAAKDVPMLDLAAQYLLICEAVELAEGNVLGAPVRTKILGATRLSVSPVLETMRWSLLVKNEAGLVSSNWTTYAKSIAGEGFTAPSVLRLRLAGFDVDDTRRDAEEPLRGQVALIMPQTKVEVMV
jgi:hypothetical protein